MKILLTTLNAKFIHSSLALRLLRSYSRERFSDIELVEYTINDITINIVADIYKRKPDVVGFSCYIWNINETLDVVRNLKKVCPDTLIVLGGPEVSYDADQWMKKHPYIDLIVMGEGEATFLELCTTYEQALETGEAPDWKQVAGLAYRADEMVRFSMPREQIADLNTIPSPYEDHLDELTNRIVYYESSRGCPFKCQYCLSSIEDGVRFYDLERVKRELGILINHGIKTIKFLDRTFNINKKYALEIFQFLIDNHNGTIFQFEITADILRSDVVDFLVENAPPGIFRFEIGVQSTNDETNRLVQRIQRFDRLSANVLRLKESGKIVQHLDLIAGLPEEDYDSFRKTFNDVFALRPEELQLGFLKMLRGTGVRARAAQHGYIYMEDAPYEILGNDVLSFGDMLRIKQAEDMLEKYWNAHRMDSTLEWIFAHRFFGTPFDFFQSFGAFWEEQGWSRMGHQLEDLFVRLRYFLGNVSFPDIAHVESMMKFDYLWNQKHRPRKTWWVEETDKPFMQQIHASVSNERERLREDFAEDVLNGKDYFKHTMVAQLSFDLDQWFARGEMIVGDYTLVVYYPYQEGRDNTFVVVNRPVRQA